MYIADKSSSSGLRFRIAWCLGMGALVAAGILFRREAAVMGTITRAPIVLPVPLCEFPLATGNWTGRDVPVSETVQRVAGNDDFLNRHYINRASDQWVNVYVAYSARPRTMIGHRPRVCYEGGGWVHDGTEQSQIESASGVSIPCLIHRFHKPSPNYYSIVVINYYLVNGRLTSDEGVFTGLAWRTPNIGNDPARYVAQVQVSSVLENSARVAVRDLTDSIMSFFPDENGNVAAEDNEPQGGL